MYVVALIRVSHPRFQVRNLSVQPAGLLGAKLFLDGQRLKREKGAYRALDDTGVPASITLKTVFDPIPTVHVDGVSVQIARPLRWFEYIWAGWPLLLIGVGGALGGGLGGGAAYLNLQIIRKDWPAAARYLACAGIGLVALATYAILAALIQSIGRS